MRSPTRSRAATSTTSRRTRRSPAAGGVSRPHGGGAETPSISATWSRPSRAKMIRRHPHVFADDDGQLAPSQVKGLWDRIKAEEKAERAARRPPEAAHTSLLSGVKAAQPALTRAMELQRKASTVGFDWNDPRAVLRQDPRGSRRDRGRARRRRQAQSSRPRSAICCSPWSTSPAMSTPIRKPRCAPPMPNSSGALPLSSARWPRRAARWRRRHWPRWTRCGMRPRAEKRPRRLREATKCAANSTVVPATAARYRIATAKPTDAAQHRTGSPRYPAWSRPARSYQNGRRAAPSPTPRNCGAASDGPRRRRNSPTG